jgi:RNA polymerase sigma factor (sigma-70 family)
MTDSLDLLAEYRRNGSDAAFRELVARFLDLVYSTSLRLVEGDTHRAEDVTQTVFVDLARLARTLPHEVRLGGWLHRHTCFVAANTLRGERRRQARERQAVEMNALQNQSEADFSQVAPLLDEAINELGEADRTAILLRFFEQQDFRAVGQALGSNEDAARMRVTRALEKLEGFLKRRGVTTSAAGLGVVLTANAVQAAPAGLVVTISTAAALAGTTIAATATATATKAIAMTTLQKSLITVTIAVAVGTGTYKTYQAARLRDQLQELREQQTEQAQQLTHERDDATRQLAMLREDNERLSRSSVELLRLRGLVGTLNRQIELATNSQPPSSQTAESRPAWKLRELRWPNEFQNVGLETPQAAAETLLWAAQHEPRRLINMVHLPEDLQQRYRKYPETAADFVKDVTERVRGYTQFAGSAPHQIWLDGGDLKSGLQAITGLKDGSVVTNRYGSYIGFEVHGRENMSDAATDRFQDMNLFKINGAWKLIIPVISPDTP